MALIVFFGNGYTPVHWGKGFYGDIVRRCPSRNVVQIFNIANYPLVIGNIKEIAQIISRPRINPDAPISFGCYPRVHHNTFFLLVKVSLNAPLYVKLFPRQHTN